MSEPTSEPKGPESSTPTIIDETSEESPANAPTYGKGAVFWLSFFAILVSNLLAALDLTAVATILPTLTHDLNGQDKFTWVGSAYSLASAAILPLVGGLSDSFGRKPVLIASILIFALGSALAGAAKDMNMMIGARSKKISHVFAIFLLNISVAVQGIGGGAIATVAQIITADLVPMKERSLYQGYISLVYAFASGIGPIIVSVATISVGTSELTSGIGWCFRRQRDMAMAFL